MRAAEAKKLPREPREQIFMQRLLLALGRRKDMRVWRQNVGQVLVRNARGKVQRTFQAGPPNGAADISGIVFDGGWRLEIECKSLTGEHCEQQERWARMIEKAGGIYVLVRGDGSPESIAQAVADIEAAIRKRRFRGVPA